MKTICLDFDDFSVLNNDLNLLLQLKEHYPKLKVTMFTIPLDAKYEKNVSLKIMREKELQKIKDNLDWIQIVPHGLFHLPKEMEKIDYESFKNIIIPAIDDCFKRDGLPYEKGFKAPYWVWNKDIVKALDDLGWWGAVDIHQPNMLRTKKYYQYNYDINSLYYKSKKKVLKLHGHVDKISENDLTKCFIHLFKLPSDAKYVFASELLENK